MVSKKSTGDSLGYGFLRYACPGRVLDALYRRSAREEPAAASSPRFPPLGILMVLLRTRASETASHERKPYLEATGDGNRGRQPGTDGTFSDILSDTVKWVTSRLSPVSPVSPVSQVPTYFFSPSAVQTATPPACVQEGFTGYFIDVSYYVADANSSRVSQSGMAPGENLGDGTGWHDAFATPTTTRSDGSFDDTPQGSCYGTSGHFCAAANPQSFRLTNNGKVFSIMTNTTRRTCTDGIRLVIQGNPTSQNKTYTLGNTQ
jgi:hypothetical protein